jgi:breast cancer 2 susceptibility protein
MILFKLLSWKRYERELNQAQRPALRLIVTQDAPAALPLALCVSDIVWFEAEHRRGVTYPELEVTDGWYRLKAKIDAPMARAIKRDVIRIGRKIGVAGARVKSSSQVN